jgi:hypothetical protein
MKMRKRKREREREDLKNKKSLLPKESLSEG